MYKLHKVAPVNNIYPDLVPTPKPFFDKNFTKPLFLYVQHHNYGNGKRMCIPLKNAIEMQFIFDNYYKPY